MLKITAELLDEAGEEINTFPVLIAETERPLLIAGATVELPINISRNERSERILEGVKKPSVRVLGARTQADENSPFALEVGLGADDKTHLGLTPQILGGRAFVKVRKQDRLVVRLINRAPHECAVRLTLDGLGWDTFSADGVTGRLVIVPSRGHVDVNGWYQNSSGVRGFSVTDYPDSAVSLRHPPSDSIGTISAAFHACWPAGGAPPDSVGKRDTSSDLAIGLGKQITQEFVPVERTVGSVRSVISVRYRK